MSAKIERSNGNLVDIPSGAVIRNDGRVYMNTRHYYVAGKDGKNGYRTHDKMCIGIVSGDEGTHKMYANAAYIQKYIPEMMPDRPEQDDSIVIGPYAVVRTLAESSGLIEKLTYTFGIENTQLILDLATYMLVEESAVFQHFPHWARRHVLFSATIRSDSYISRFLTDSISIPKIMQFKKDWASANIGDGNVYVCYDSTNVNSQAEGVFLVQRGHAKDDPNLEQVNTDYVIRQSDGLPLTFMEFPGSVADIAQASEMIRFMQQITDSSEQEVHPTMVCDRGYISEENVELMDECGVNFLLMLRSNLTDCVTLLKKHSREVKSNYENYFREFDEYGKTVSGLLFENGSERYYHIIWNPALESSHRRALFNKIDNTRSVLENAVKRSSRQSETEWRKYRKWFHLTLEESGVSQLHLRGHKKNKDTTTKMFVLKDFREDQEKIHEQLDMCGFYVLVTSQKMTAFEARTAYSKRDCVEKTFRALKSSLGMDKLGVFSDQSIHGKSLIWFIAAILHSLLFQRLSNLRTSDRKHYTVPASLDLIDEITADRNLKTGTYERRYKLIKRQSNILSSCSIDISEIDSIIADL